MNEFLMALQALNALLPLVGAVETMFGPGTGTQKKQVVDAAVAHSIDVAAQLGAQTLQDPKAAQLVKDTASSFTEVVVGAANAAGVFKPRAETPSA
jgi:hypothetical protein